MFILALNIRSKHSLSELVFTQGLFDKAQAKLLLDRSTYFSALFLYEDSLNVL